MGRHTFATTPPQIETMPPGIPYIIGNEAAERFSYYGMRSILVIYMTKSLLFPEEQAKEYYHYFVMATYFFPLLGAMIADGFLGKYRTIIALSIVYCLGHLALSVHDTQIGMAVTSRIAPIVQQWGLHMDQVRIGLTISLSLIAIGAGGIKPCVSAHVGDQFGERNQQLVTKVFGWFYFAINFGAFISTLLTPWLLEHKSFGPRVAFGVPGALMLLATTVFWMGRNKFVHIPPGGLEFVRQSFSGEGLRAILNLSLIYVFVAIFWSLYDQGGSSWVLQAEHMDRTFLGIKWSSSQIQAINPILILVFIPLFSYGIYPAIQRFIPLTPLRRISVGLFLTVIPFALCALVEGRIQAGEVPSIHWQLLAYVVITAAEILVSITSLEFSYTQAPPAMKSMVMSLYMLSVSAGNLLTAGVNHFIQNPDGSSKLPGASYYWFFTGIMLAAAVGFIFVAMNYRGRTYIQGENEEQFPSPGESSNEPAVA